MPVMECEKHGYVITQFCCTHIIRAFQAGKPMQVFVAKQPGGNLHLCMKCREAWLAIPKKDREEQKSRLYRSFFSQLGVLCPECFNAWMESNP